MAGLRHDAEMDEVEFTLMDELKKWLEDKPLEWSPVIALRLALRVLPFVSDPAQFGTEPRPQLTLSIYRAMAISSSALLIPPDDMVRPAAARAAAAADDAAFAADTATDHGDAFAADAALAADAAIAAFADDAAVAALAASTAARAYVADDAAATDFWHALSSDCQKLLQGQAPRELLASRLWESEPDWYLNIAKRADAWMRGAGKGFEIWAEWYDRRRLGKATAFDRFDEGADQNFYTRLIEQDDDWWERDPAIVNADIAGWVEDLRGPPPPQISDAELEQNPNVIIFAIDDEGCVALASEPLPNGLQSDQDTRDNYDELKRLMALAIGVSQTGLTQAVDMAKPAQACLDALGATVEEVRPRLLVLRGNELARQIDTRMSDASMLPPLSQEQEDAFIPLQAAYKMFVQEDPKLAKLNQADFETEGEVLTPELVKAIAEAVQETGIAQDDAADAITDAANSVDGEADEDDPRRKTASESIKNMFRAIGRGIKKVDGAVKFTDRVARLLEKGGKLYDKLGPSFSEDSLIGRILKMIGDL